jgi:glyoxylase-like metal-dependent hydrolase (beta-lactamase superfamily II)
MGVTSQVDRVTEDLVRLRFLFVNLFLFGRPGMFVAIDAGLQGCAGQVIKTAEDHFGPGAKPEAFLLTHAHFDHIGAVSGDLRNLGRAGFRPSARTSVLTGQSDYPPPDPTVGKGAMALMSFAYPSKGIDLGGRARALPEDGSVPFMPGWRWIHTPGHTPGHVALFRDTDRCLVAGDAFVTTKQESLYAVMTQREEVQGPPAYFTPDWHSARQSVEQLAALDPAIAATGHGTPMRGEELRAGLGVSSPSSTRSPCRPKAAMSLRR